MSAKKWETLFTKKTLEEGKEFYATGKAKKLTEEDDGYSAKVRDDRNYDVKIETDYDGEENLYITDMSCTCSKGTLCSHCAAVLYLISDQTDIYANVTEGGVTYGMVKQTAAQRKKQQQEAEKEKKAEEERKAEEAPAAQEEKKEPVRMLPSVSGIAALQRSEKKEREKAAKEDKSLAVYRPDEYRYFHYENFEKGLNMPPDRVRKAKAVRAEIQNVEVRLLQQDKARGDGKDAIIGEIVCYFDNSYNNVSLRFGQDRLISVKCSNWSCYLRSDSKSYNGLYMCEHAIAALMVLKDYLASNNIGDSTNRAGYALLNEVLSEKNSLEQGDSITHETLFIEPNPEIDSNNRMSVFFRTGASKLYKIKNLREFYENMQQENDMKFGTKTVLHMGKAFLDEKSEKWYEFISEVIDEEDERRSRSESYYYDPPVETKTDIDLYGDRLDQFVNLMMGERVDFTVRSASGGRAKEKLLVQEKDPELSLEIHKDVDPGTKVFNGVILSGTVPEIISGRKNAYYLESGTFNRISEDTYRKIRLFLESADDGKISISIGRGKLADFYHKALPILKKSVNITEYDGDTVARYLPPEPVFTIYLDTENDTVIGRVEVAYGMQVRSGTDLLEERAGRRQFEPYRDRGKEEAVLTLVMKYLTTYDERTGILFSYRDDEVIFDLLNEGLDQFLELADVRMTDRFRRLGLKRHVKFRMGVSIESGLLDLTVTADELSEDEMLDILYQYQKKRKFVKLKNGDFLKIQGNEAVEQIAQMMEALHLNVKDFTKGKMHIPAYRALYLEKMLENTEDIYADRDRHFRQLIKEFKTVQDADYEVPDNLKDVMRKYQREGYEWLRTLDTYGFGGILADEMGLGKTLQTIACILAVKNEREAGTASKEGAAAKPGKEEPVTSLVVCPASLVFNWGEELAKFAPSLKTVLVTGTQAERAEIIRTSTDADVLVTSYDLLKRDIAEYDGRTFRFEVIDEAQYIKNQGTAAAKAVKIIHSKTRFALTGTPIENRLSELWSIFDYLMPGFLYDYSEFRSSVEQPIVKYGDEKVQERLKKMVAPFILRRKKEDVLKDLPEKLEEVRYAGMSGKQQKLYDAEVIRMRDTIEHQDDADFRKSKIRILAELMKIRQICCDPELCYSNYDGESAKKEACMDLVESLVDGGHKALIFSQFTSMLELLKVELDKRNIAYYEITGATPKEKRLELVNAFNTDDTPIFLISLKAGGTGLNLTGADVVIHYDPWWNTAAQDQATDRAHRIGQTKVVTVYKLIMKGTIEEKILEMQEKKKQLADEILSGENIASSTITREDLLAMLD